MFAGSVITERRRKGWREEERGGERRRRRRRRRRAKEEEERVTRGITQLLASLFPVVLLSDHKRRQVTLPYPQVRQEMQRLQQLS